jgi:hypothetical protein
LKTGKHLDADVIVTATGLKLSMRARLRRSASMASPIDSERALLLP